MNFRDFDEERNASFFAGFNLGGWIGEPLLLLSQSSSCIQSFSSNFQVKMCVIHASSLLFIISSGAARKQRKREIIFNQTRLRYKKYSFLYQSMLVNYVQLFKLEIHNSRNISYFSCTTDRTSFKAVYRNCRILKKVKKKKT